MLKIINKPVLDACCGSKMFYFDKENPEVLFQDIRLLKTTLCDGRQLVIRPDVNWDFRCMPYNDDTFYMVVFDPPHLLHLGVTSWMYKKYGKLPDNWKEYLQAGFKECFRVLRPYGTLVFKWNSEQIPFSKVIKLAPQEPLLGDKRGKTRWVVFIKGK